MPPNDAVKKKVDKFTQAAVNENEKSPQAVQQGRATRHPSIAIRRAFCRDDADYHTGLVCHLDTDGTGEEVYVICNISGGSKLDEASRLLKDGDPIMVTKIGSLWYAIEGFQTIGVGLDFDDDGKLKSALVVCT